MSPAFSHAITSPVVREKPFWIASYMPSSGSELQAVSRPDSDSSTSSESSVEPPSTTTYSCGTVAASRTDEIVSARNAPWFRLGVTTLIDGDVIRRARCAA